MVLRVFKKLHNFDLNKKVLDRAFLELKSDLNFVKRCIKAFGADFLGSKLWMQNRGNMLLIQTAALCYPSDILKLVDSSFLASDAFVAAVMVGFMRRNLNEEALEFVKGTKFKSQLRTIAKQMIIIDGSYLYLQNFERARGNREFVKLAVSPGPHDDFLDCRDRHENLKYADLKIFNKDSDLNVFMKDLVQLGCRKTDFPPTVWDDFFAQMSREEQCSFAASVLLTSDLEGVSNLGCNIWYDLPHVVTDVFQDCSAYQCGICFGIPMTVFNCLEGCSFYCCQDCRGEIRGSCPGCRADQKGPCGRRCRAAEVRQ